MIKKRSGFTLLEILVVIAIIAILIALLLPAIQKVREASSSARCMSNMKQLMIAVHSFHQMHNSLPTYNGVFPPSGGTTGQSTNPRAVYGSWFVHLMPHLEYGNLYDLIAGDVDNYSNTGGKVNSPGGTLISPAEPAVYDYSGSTLIPGIPATYKDYDAAYADWLAKGQTLEPSVTANGYTIYTLQPPAPKKTADPGTGTH